MLSTAISLSISNAIYEKASDHALFSPAHDMRKKNKQTCLQSLNNILSFFF